MPSDDDSDHRERPTRRPTAVALTYEPETDDAPRVVASGYGQVAERILALAFAHGVKVREDADLAELLAAIEIDSEIPPEAFAAVAEILVYVYRANNRSVEEPAPADGPGAAGQ